MTSIGIDIEEVKRFKRLLVNRKSLLEKLFSAYEWTHANQKNSPQTLAGIWCAKEATVKALSNFYKVTPTDVYISHLSSGRPFVLMIKEVCIKNFHIDISISHTKSTATAICLISKID